MGQSKILGESQDCTHTSKSCTTVNLKVKWKWRLLSRVWLCHPMNNTVHGIFQARILKWVAFPFSRGSAQPRDRTQVSCIAGRFFTSWATREAQENEWVAYPFASRSPWPRNRTGISCIASGFFTNWVMREAPTVNFQDLKKQNLLLSLTSRLWDYFLSSMVVWEYLALKFFVASNI